MGTALRYGWQPGDYPDTDGRGDLDEQDRRLAERRSI